MQRCASEYPNDLAVLYYSFLIQESLFELVLLARKKEASNKNSYISCMTHAKILVILVFQLGPENQLALRKNGVL